MNLEELQGVLRLLGEHDIAEFELEEQGLKLRVRRAAAQTGALALSTPAISAVVPTGSPAATAAPPSRADQPAAAPPPSPVEEDASLYVVKSPIVGTFYRAPDPASPPFVNVGDRVRVGQVLCIIEAMKLMNEIEAEVAGEIVSVQHDNGQPVQYGEPLFSLRPDR